MFCHLKKYGMISLIILIGFMGFTLITKSGESSNKSPETLIVGLQSGYPPFEFIDKSGHIVGFDVDLAQLLSTKLGKKLVIKDMEFEGIILSLKQSKIDLSISGMNITPGRLKEIIMVPYHGEEATSLSLIFWGQIPEGVKSIEDVAKLPNPIISVELGAIPETYMSTHYPQLHVNSLQGAMNPLMDVKMGKSIAQLVEPAVAQYLQNKFSEIQVLDIPLKPEEQIMGFGIGIKKGNDALANPIIQIIQELKDSGALEQLEKKWFKGEE